MTVLATGDCGHIGSHLVWGLADCGEAVVVFDGLSTGFDWQTAPKAGPIRSAIGAAAQCCDSRVIRSRRPSTAARLPCMRSTDRK